jgi:hypothetical protein
MKQLHTKAAIRHLTLTPGTINVVLPLVVGNLQAQQVPVLHRTFAYKRGAPQSWKLPEIEKAKYCVGPQRDHNDD